MKRLVLFMMAVMLLSIIVNAQKKGGKTLVAYFSATGTTARAAKLVAETVDGTLYEIQPAKKYTAADLDWHDKASRSSVEMSDSKSRFQSLGRVQRLGVFPPYITTILPNRCRERSG